MLHQRRALLTGSVFNARVAQWKQRSLIKSVQRGQMTLAGVVSNTASITAVDLANTIITNLGWRSNNAGDNMPDASTRIALTNATTVTGTKLSNSGGGTIVVAFDVIEFYPGVLRSIQRGVISIASTDQNTATITTVNTAKSFVINLGEEVTSVTTTSEFANLTLTNGTTVTATRVANGAPTTLVGFEVVEFY